LKLIIAIAERVGRIIERNRTEQALKESEEKFRLFMEHSPIYVFFKDEKIRALQLSKNYEKMLGRPLDELIGKTMDDLFPSALARSMIEDDKRIIREGKPIEVEEELNGRSYYTLKFPIFREGKPAFLAGFTMDITERKRAEESVKLNEERLETLLRLAQMRFQTEKELTDFALEEVVGLTQSTGGYLHFFNEDEQTVALYSWSKNVLRTCTVPREQHYPLDRAGLWADSIRLRRWVIHNDYQKIPTRKGYPEGHFHLTRHLGVPIFDGDRIVGVAGVSNKDEPYNESDARQITLFMNSMWSILKQWRSEADREKLIGELKEALAKIKTLTGMLPICSSCKKIRNDSGYWEQIEVYLREHSEAEFSHGICPDCAKKLYPEFFNNDERK
jgi:PAS domain S-box-containing protein